ncbi:MAG TPA: hypothetical protein VLB84_05275 [Bacteroidia bacterium]|nr:hypothetical protein [Bacteroidia bacterium]
MKKIFFLSFIGLLFAYAFTPVQTSDNVDKNALSAGCKKKMEPYKYDSQKFTRINFMKKPQQLEVEVPVFVGEKYRVVFNLAAMPENPPIGINVYTKSKESGKRETIFSNKDVPAGTSELVFDAPRLRKLFIDYDVPAVADSVDGKISGYILFMVGYK